MQKRNVGQKKSEISNILKENKQWNQRECAEMCDLASVFTGMCMWTTQTHVKW